MCDSSSTDGDINGHISSCSGGDIPDLNEVDEDLRLALGTIDQAVSRLTNITELTDTAGSSILLYIR